jgi:uncharacterized membrane protein
MQARHRMADMLVAANFARRNAAPVKDSEAAAGDAHRSRFSRAGPPTAEQRPRPHVPSRPQGGRSTTIRLRERALAHFGTVSQLQERAPPEGAPRRATAGPGSTSKAASECSPLAFATWQLVISAACIGIGMLIFEGVPELHFLRFSTLVAFGYHALLGQALASALWFEVLAKVPASVAALGTLTVPAVGVFTAMLFLGERPTFADLLGLALIVGAAATVLIPSRPDPGLRPRC